MKVDILFVKIKIYVPLDFQCILYDVILLEMFAEKIQEKTRAGIDQSKVQPGSKFLFMVSFSDIFFLFT